MKTLIAAAVLSFLAASQDSLAQAELDSEHGGMRTPGMGPDAKVHVDTLAAVLGGIVVLEPVDTPEGHLGRRYMNAACFAPGADAEKLAAARERLTSRKDAWVPLIARAADADASGSVTAREALALRSSVEMGLVAVQLPAGTTLDAFIQRLGVPRDVVVKNLRGYERIRASALAGGPTELPPLPDGFARAVRLLESEKAS